MTLEEAVTAYSLAYGHCLYNGTWQNGEREFAKELIRQLGGQYYALNIGDILSCARDPSVIERYTRLQVEVPLPHAGYDTIRPGSTVPKQSSEVNYMYYETQVQKQRRRRQILAALKGAAITTFDIIGVLYIVAAVYVHYNF